MATQLRAVPAYEPSTIETISNGLDYVRDLLGETLPEAEEINFSFGKRGLMVEIKTGKREDRERMMFRLLDQPLDFATFDKIVEGVETGSRRRLTITAEVR